ncbi:protein phosphatase 2C domain-containing protein (plasmid) [Herbiconiux sp. KACC 21604]|uniref:PP2C family protein-serine/threonine phosphatase n=1 Tax=unclassified Herbiconiux TaxID=2618217 RepID=UPI001492262C|nr:MULTISPECIES: protein phosphatase 2C domain-containing protein [unclassified Herbiconiux]QJU56251.1 SpoIIE family protein phosphatase [Herbiconiux sp. SALV-R1]WPO88865.1 protein phosphatase 2C domain-containing protein [Herbiconiux sp. KACC 21604]
MNRHLVLECRGHQILGERGSQNDSYLYGPHGAFVADGVGNGEGARNTADAAVRFYTKLTGETFTVDNLLDAPTAFAATRVGRQGATTMVGAALDGDRLWMIGHGDSLYLHVRNGELLHRSVPHNEAGRLASLGLSSPATAQATLTRALAAEPLGASDIRVTRAAAGDTIMLMTDGFAALVRIAEVVSLAIEGVNATDLRDALLRLTADSTPDDNATFVVAQIVDYHADRTAEDPA